MAHGMGEWLNGWDVRGFPSVLPAQPGLLSTYLETNERTSHQMVGECRSTDVFSPDPPVNLPMSLSLDHFTLSLCLSPSSPSLSNPPASAVLLQGRNSHASRSWCPTASAIAHSGSTSASRTLLGTLIYAVTRVAGPPRPWINALSYTHTLSLSLHCPCQSVPWLHGNRPPGEASSCLSRAMSSTPRPRHWSRGY